MILTNNLKLVMKAPSIFDLKPNKMDDFLEWYYGKVKADFHIDNEMFLRILDKM